MKNFIPRGNKTRAQRIRTNVKQNSFSVCCMSLVNDINVNLVCRSLCNFAGIEMFIVGSNQWHKGATNGLKNVIKIHYFQDVNSFFQYINDTDYDLVAVEQSERSVSLNTFIHPKKPCFIFGAEDYGLTDDVLLNVKDVVEIPMDGYHPNGNVGVCSGIVFYDYVSKLKENIL